MSLTRASKADGYRLLLHDAERDVETARVAVAQHRHGAAKRLRDAERFLDDVRRRGGIEPETFGLPETLRADFGTDEDAPR